MPRFALIVIDMLNRYEHDDAEPLRDSVRAVIEPMAGLIAQAKEAGACLVYVNDNHGDWAAGREALTEKALQGADPSLVAPIAPDDDVPLLVKVRPWCMRTACCSLRPIASRTERPEGVGGRLAVATRRMARAVRKLGRRMAR